LLMALQPVGFRLAQTGRRPVETTQCANLHRFPLRWHALGAQLRRIWLRPLEAALEPRNG